MHPAIHDLESLLAASSHMLRIKDLNVDGLLNWGAARDALFKRIENLECALVDDDSSMIAELIRALLEADAKVRARIIEFQTDLARQITAARKTRQALMQGVSNTPLLLLRSV